jgi:hypothetical protein
MTPNAEQAADLLLPLGGPYYEPDAVMETAAAVAELVRRLNHATRHTDALWYPSELDRVVGSLNAAVYGLEQTCGQLADRLDIWADDPDVGHDGRDSPQVACELAADHLRHAAAARAAMTGPLESARALTSHLTHTHLSGR